MMISQIPDPDTGKKQMLTQCNANPRPLIFCPPFIIIHHLSTSILSPFSPPNQSSDRPLLKPPSSQ